MNDNLNFGIHFDLEKGLKDAQADWAKVEKEFTNRTIKIKISVPKATTIDNLEAVTKRLKELKIEPVTLETKSAIQSLVRELKSMEKVLIEINRLNNNSKVPIVTAKANKVNASIVQQEALAQERLTQAKIRTQKAQLQLEVAQRKGTATTKAHTYAYSKQAGMLDSLKRSFAAYTGLFAVARIVTKIREITGEFELQRVALGAIIQDKGRADQLFFQIQAKALESPYEVKELVTYTKQLAAYRIETEQLFDTTMRLADISAGLGVEMDRLILAYGQVKAASVLRGQELRQFTEAGIPLVQLLADKFTILNGEATSTGDVFKLISNRAVSFEMVKEIFEDMTNAGGIFYNMQAIQSKTLAGSWANLKDAADLAFNEIGQSQYGLMKGTVDVTKSMLANWSSIQPVLEGLVTTYALYKIAVITSTRMMGQELTATLANTLANKQKEASILRQAAMYRALSEEELMLIATRNQLTFADYKQLLASGLLTKETLLRLLATKKLTKEEALALGMSLNITQAEVIQAASTKRLTRMKMGLTGALANVTRSFKAFFATLLTNPFTYITAAIGVVLSLVWKITAATVATNKQIKESSEAAAVYVNSLRKQFSDIKDTVDLGLSEGATQEQMKKASLSLQTIIEKNQELKPIVEARLKNITDETEKLLKLKEIYDDIVAGSVDVSAMSKTLINANVGSENKLFGVVPVWWEGSFTEKAAKAQKALDGIDGVLSNMASRGTDVAFIQEDLKNLAKEGADAGEVIAYLGKVQDSFWTGGKIGVGAIKKGYENYVDLGREIQNIKDAYGEAQAKAEGFWNYFKASNKEVNGQIINWEDKATFGLNEANLSKFRTNLALARKDWLATLEDNEKSALNMINTLNNQQVYIPIKIGGTGVTGENPYVTDINNYIKKLNEGKEAKYQIQLIPSESEGDILKLLDTIEEKKKALQKTNSELKQNPEFKTNAALIKQYNLLLNHFKIYPKEVVKAGKTRLELLQEEINLVEKAYKKYQTLKESIGDVAAQQKIQQEYGGLITNFDLAFSDADFNAQLNSFQKKIKKLPKSQKISFEAGIKISDNEIETFKKKLKDEMDRIKDEINQEQQKIDFFNSIFKTTGDEETAKRMTEKLFGTMGDMKELVQTQLAAVFESPMDAQLEMFKSLPVNVETDKAVKDIFKFKQAFRDATNGVKIDYETLRGLIKILPKESRAAATEMLNSQTSTNAKTVQDFMESIQKYKTFEDRKKELRDAAASDIKRQEELGIITDKEKAARMAKLARDLSDLSAEELKASEDWQKTFGDLDLLASTTIDRLIDKLENLIKTDKNLKPENLKLYREEIEKLKAQKVKDNPFKAITEGLKEYIAATKKLNAEQSKAEPNAKVIETAIEAQKVALKKLESGVQAASAAFSQLQSFVSSINELFGATEDTELGAFMLDLATALGYVASALGVVAAAIAVIDALGAPFLIIAAAIAGIAALGMWISSADTRKANKEIEKQERIIAELERSYKKLQEASEKAFGVEWLKAQEAELENLKAQQIAYEKQAQAERDKGKDKDEERLLEYENNAKDVADRIAAYQDNLIKKFTGTDLTSFASDLAKAYLDAYIAIGRQGAITTDELKNQWRSLVKTMIVESFVASAIQGAFQQTFEDITALYENGKVPTAEEINALTQQGAGVIDILGTTLPQLLEGLDLSGLGDASSKLSGLAKGIEGITEQQANVLSAAINTQNFYLFTMMTIMKKWDVDNVTQTTTMTNLFTIQNSFLQELPFIRQNTEDTVTACNNIAATCNDIKSTLNAVTQISGAKKCVNTILNNT